MPYACWDEAFDVVSGDLDIYATYTATPIQTEPTDPSEPGEKPSEPSTDTDTPTGNEQTGGEQSGDKDNPDAGKTESPETGDNGNIVLWIAGLLASGAALAGTAIYGRKRKYNR